MMVPVENNWFMTDKDNHWEKPLYLCLWDQPECLEFRERIFWLKGTGRFDLLGISEGGTCILAEAKPVLRTASDVGKIAEKIEGTWATILTYLERGSSWDGHGAEHWRNWKELSERKKL